MSIFDSIILGIVEGITEFLPISSTAHLILTSKLLDLEQTASIKIYETIIQLGAILSVVLIYKDKIFWQNSEKNSFDKTFKLYLKLFVAFVPTGFVGLFFYSYIKAFFTFNSTIYFMIFAGVVFIIVELLYKPQEHHIGDIQHTTYTKSFLIGLFQTISLLPGISRSGATIIGGMLVGLKRKTAVEFSFLLAIPTMLIATAYEVYKNFESFVYDDVLVILVGFVVSFISSYIAVKWFLGFVQRYSFIPFGFYLIFSGIGFYFYL